MKKNSPKNNIIPDKAILASILADKARRAAEIQGVTVATLSGKITKDARFIGKVANGANFTIDRFQEVIAELDKIIEAT